MTNSNKTKLSQQQIFQRSFEENSDRIRVTLGDAEDDITVNSNGSINSVIQDADGNPISNLNPLHVIDDAAILELEGINSELDGIHTDLNTQFNQTKTTIIEQTSNLISTLNSSYTPLLAGATFTGDWESCVHYISINITLKSDVDSASSGVMLEFSSNGSTVIRSIASTHIGSSNGIYFSIPTEAKFYRIRYTNGGINQTIFELETVLTRTLNGVASVPVGIPISDETSTLITRSVIAGKSVNGVYTNQRASGISTLNSTSSILGAGTTFTGAWEEVVGYANVAITVFSDVPSATDGLKFEYSTDGINIDDHDYFGIPSNNGNQFSSGITSRYFRVRYTNGVTPQTQFRLQTMYHIAAPKPSTHRIDDAIDGQNDAELSKSVLTGKNPDGIFENARISGVVSSNSSTTPLGIGGIFQGTYFDSAIFAANSYTCLTDQVGIITVETSDDQLTIIRSTVYNVIPNETFYISQTPVGKYVRVRFENTSGVAQTIFRLQVLQKITPISSTALTISEPLNNNSIATNSRSILAGQQENGTFSNVGLSNSASIKVAVTDRPSEVRNRVKVQARIFNTSLTTTPSVVYTVTPGKILYVESMIISALNAANTTGEYRITDAAVDRFGYLLGEKVSGGPSVSSVTSPALPEPIPFTTNFGIREVTGDVIVSVYIIGYEETI